MKQELQNQAIRIIKDAEQIKEQYREYLLNLSDEVIKRIRIDTETKEDVQHTFIWKQLKEVYGHNYQSDAVYYTFKSVLNS